MKKLFALLLMLGGALSSWAYGGHEGQTVNGITFSEIGPAEGGPTQIITFTAEGTGNLATWWNNLGDPEKNQFTEGNNPDKKLIVSGPMSDDDFSVISGWNKFNFADFSGVTGVAPDDISGLNLPNATTIVLPTGWTEAQVKTAGGILASDGKNGNLGTAFSKNPYVKQVETTTYYYVKDGQNVTYTDPVTNGQTTVTINEPVTITDLTNASDYPKSTYTNSWFNNTVVEVQPSEGQTSWIPNPLDVALNATTEYTCKLGTLDSWCTVGNGMYVSSNGKTYLETWYCGQKGWSYENEADREVSVKATYTIASLNNQLYGVYVNGVAQEGSGQLFTLDNGTVYGQIANEGENPVSFTITTKYKYKYTLDGNDIETQEFDSPQTQIQTTHDVTYDLLSNTVTDNFNLTKIFAYVNVAGSFDDAVNVAGITKSSVGEIALINGINNDDLAELSKNNYANVEYINMKEAVLTGDITTLNARGEAAILLPQINDNGTTRHITDAELGTLQAKNINNPNEQYFHCLAYFKSNDASKPESKQLNIYAFDNAVGKLSNVVKAEDKIAITFVPRYTEEGDFFNIYGGSVRGFVGYQFTRSSDFNSLKEGIGQLPAISIDMEIIHNRMIPDFTFLNEHTHYIQVHGNVNTDEMKDKYDNRYDISSETEPTVYVYPNTVWVVSTYKVDESHAYVHDENGNPVVIGKDDQDNDIWQRTGLGTYSHFGGERFFAAQEPTNIVYVRDRSKLQGCDDVPSLLAEAKKYFGNDQMFASQQIFVGSYNNADIAAINNDFAATTIDFMSASSFEQVNGKDCVANLTNSKVQYLLLPDNHESVINATSADACAFSTNCSALLCVGAYNETDNRLTTWSKQAGVVANLTSKLYPMVGTHHYGNQYTTYCNGLTKVTMSGYLNRDDLLNDTGKGLLGSSIQEADFTNAYFPTYTDMVFCLDATSTVAPGYGWDKITKISLPTDSRQEIIPDYCLSGAGVLTEICIPSNYETIGIDAFFGTDLTHVYTTAYPGDENNFIVDTDGDGIVDVYDHGDHTITLSSNLQEIRRGAFCTKIGNANKGFSDVYVLRAEAPKCEGNAFHSVSYMGNNTFAGSTVHPISRGSYEVNHGYLAVLHYPSSVTEEQEAKFTDVTRDYTLTDELGMYNNKGEIISWPRQTEFLRAYNQAVSGVTWNGWPTTRPYGSIEDAGRGDYNEIIYDGTSAGLQNGTIGGTSMYYGQDSAAGTIGLPDPTGDDNDYPGSYNEDYAYDWANYMGWHQFVLTNGNSTQQKKTVATEYVDGGWYTLCLPYDMTAAEVIEAMGAPAGSTFDNTKRYNYASELGVFPRVYSLRTVKRDYPDIYLTFSLELMAKTAAGEALSFDNENGTIDYVTPTEMYKKKGEVVYLRGGYPYLVRPLVPKDNPDVIGDNLGNYILKNMQFDEDDLGNKAEVKTGQFIAMPIISQKILALNKAGSPVKFSSTDGDVLDTEYYYYFQGTYADQDMPEAYYLSGGKWNRQRKESEKKTWEGFTAIIGGKAHKTTGSIYKTDNPSPTSFTGITTYYVSLTSKNDDFTKVGDNRVKYQFLFEGEEGFDEAVAIDKIDGKDINAVTEGNVYNMAGQLVGSSLDGLAKGLYIQNGKKVMVK